MPRRRPEPPRLRPRVVLLRPTDIVTDSRVKKMAASLVRLGYDATILGRSPDRRRHAGRAAGADVLLVPLRGRLSGPALRVFRWRRRLRGLERRANRTLQHVERWVDTRVRSWTHPDVHRFRRNQHDFRVTWGSELVRIRPDVVHVHDPRMLPVAFAAARRLRRHYRHTCEVVYDARENFGGLSGADADIPVYHQRILKAETKWAPHTAAVLTVSDPVGNALGARSALRQPPTVLLNVPVRRPTGLCPRSLRADAGIPADAKVLVYPGAANQTRGVETIFRALRFLPDVHAVLVIVPFPHPRADELLETAAELGVADRVHLVPPVPVDEVPDYLGQADVGVHPMLGGIPNHEMAMPNKLFEILHAGLPIAVSDVRAMAAFVREHDLGAVFTPGDAVELAEAVGKLIDAAAVREPTPSAVIDRFSWQGQEATLLGAYRQTRTAPPMNEPGDFPALTVEWA